MLTSTPGWGPDKRRRRAGTRTRAYIKNNNKNLLALQTAQPVPGDRLAWHFQTSWTCPNSSQTWAPSHARRCSPQQSAQHASWSPPSAEHNSQPPESYHPTTFQTEIRFVSLFLKEGRLSPLKLCMTRSKGSSGAGGAPFFGWRSHSSISPEEAWGRLETTW